MKFCSKNKLREKFEALHDRYRDYANPCIFAEMRINICHQCMEMREYALLFHLRETKKKRKELCQRCAFALICLSLWDNRKVVIRFTYCTHCFRSSYASYHKATSWG